MVADIFADCFSGCLTPAACGWGLITPPGTVTFDGDKMIMGAGPGPTGTAQKPTLIPMPSGGFTVQFRFTEIAAPPALAAIYAVRITDLGGPVTSIDLLGTGAVHIIHAPTGGAQVGAWVPAGVGTPHTVHYSTVGGPATLFIDGVPIPLASAPFAVPPQSPGTVLATIDNGGPPVTGAFDYIVAATGIFPPSTVFCCPGGGPTT